MKMRYFWGEKGNKRAENDTVNSFLVAERGEVTFACILKEGPVCATGMNSNTGKVAAGLGGVFI